MFSHKTTAAPTFGRVANILIGLVLLCGAILVISNALHGKTNQHIGWQLRIIGSLAEQASEVASRWYENQTVPV